MANIYSRTAEDIISSAREYRRNSKRKMTYNDYERFKSELECYGYYGYGRELSEALKL